MFRLIGDGGPSRRRPGGGRAFFTQAGRPLAGENSRQVRDGVFNLGGQIGREARRDPWTAEFNEKPARPTDHLLISSRCRGSASMISLMWVHL